ncbi:MAG: SEC-C domain-containing protein [Deltaproteobacteria bacterium]|nr:SEC-C domain-containing protein [Deltaproteobacteria bacterium]MCB9789121.1 SEC-C domain-containing protein [Deltaproteobacteria bacterium]
MSVALNAACPCGSGRKYKRCCQPADAEAAKAKRSKVPLALVGSGVVLGLIFAFTHGLRVGGLVAATGVIVAVLVLAFGDPPPPRGGGDDPAAMNFGR